MSTAIAPLVNVADFGAVPGADPAAQTSGFASAIDHAIGQGGGIYIPRGEYIATIVIPGGTSGFRVEGESRDTTIIKGNRTGVDLVTIGKEGAPCRSVNIARITLDGDFLAESGVVASSWYESAIEDVLIRRLRSTGVRCETLCIANEFLRTKAVDCWMHGFYLGSHCNRNRIQTCRVSAARNAAKTGAGVWYHAETQFGNSVIDSAIEACDVGIRIDGQYQSGAGYKIDGCYFEQIDRYDLHVETSYPDRHIVQVWFQRCTVSGGLTQTFARFDGVQNLLVDWNWIGKGKYEVGEIPNAYIGTHNGPIVAVHIPTEVSSRSIER